MTKSDAFSKFQAYMRLNNMSKDTQKQYRNWIERYFKFLAANHEIKDLPSCDKFNAFIDFIVNSDPQPSLSNQKQAFFSLLAFYRSMDQKLDGLHVPTGTRVQRTFNTLSEQQVSRLIDALPDEYKLMVRLMYGTGMRIDECLSLRIKDVDFQNGLIYIQEGKGDKPRRVDLPGSIADEMKTQIESARAVYEFDKRIGNEGVYIPHLLEKKNKSLAKSFEWFWLFPNPHYGRDRESGIKRRHHVYDFALQRAFREARKKARLPIYTTPHALRHAFATHYLKAVLRDMPQVPNLAGYVRDILRQKMGHVDANTTDIYIHLAMPKNKVLNYSPLDALSKDGGL